MEVAGIDVKLILWALQSLLALAGQALKAIFIIERVQLGQMFTAILTIVLIVWSRLLTTHRGKIGFEKSALAAKGCWHVVSDPKACILGMFKLERVIEAYKVIRYKIDRTRLDNIILMSSLTEPLPQMFVYMVTLAETWRDGGTYKDYLVTLITALAGAGSAVSDLLQYEKENLKLKGYAELKLISAPHVVFGATRLTEIFARTGGVAIFIVFCPFGGLIAGMILVEEFCVYLIIVHKFLSIPKGKFPLLMDSSFKTYVNFFWWALTVCYPLYVCVQSQRYVDAVPQPVFSYVRYYGVRGSFTALRTVLLFCLLEPDLGIGMRHGLVQVVFLSGAAMLLFFPLFLYVRRLSANIAKTKPVEDSTPHETVDAKQEEAKVAEEGEKQEEEDELTEEGATNNVAV